MRRTLPAQASSVTAGVAQLQNPSRAQRGYYELNSVAAALPQRLETLRRYVLRGSVLDVGCNDGTLTRVLLTEGRVTKAQGIDLEVLHDDFPVVPQNILDLPARQLGDFDNVLYLNVHHHLVASTYGTEKHTRPGEVLDCLLASCRRMFFEMGSVTERGTWNWLGILRSQYKSDDDAVAAILGEHLHLEILRQPMQGGVRRMFMIVGNAPDFWKPTKVQWYARNVAAYPRNKRLAKVDGPLAFPPGRIGHAPNDWMPHVKFVTFEHGGRTWLGKRHDRQKHDVARTFGIYDALRHTPFASQIVQPLYFTTKFGLILEYDPELMIAPFGNALVVHLHDVPREEFGLHTGPDRDRITALADSLVEIDGKRKRVRDWCDFQTVRTSNGLRFIDFDAF